jgi:lipopolysaccharide export system permease protein
MIIRKAFFREILQTSVAVLVILLLTSTVITTIGYLKIVSSQEFPSDSLLLMMALKTIKTVDVILLLTLFISLLLVLGRWSRDNEMVVINSCGLSLTHFIPTVISLILIYALAIGTVSLYLGPFSTRIYEEIKQEYQQRGELAGLITGEFAELHGNSKITYFIDHFDKDADRYSGIFIHTPTRDASSGKQTVITSKTGHKVVQEETGEQFFVLVTGTRYTGTAGKPGFETMTFDRYTLRTGQGEAVKIHIPLHGRPSLDLATSSRHRSISEFQWRLSKVAAIPAVALFALALGYVNTRRSRTPAIIMATLIFFSYINILGMMLAFMKRGVVDPHLSLWWVHLLFFSAALFLFFRRRDNKPLLPGFTRLFSQ